MPAPQCQQCGAAPDLDAVKKGQCRYCGTALPHAVKAAAKAQLLQQLLTDEDGDGIPDALEALQTVQKVGDERAAKEEERKRVTWRLENARDAKVTAGGVVGGGALFGIAVGLLWCLFTCGPIDSDPWLGGHAAVLCPASCDGCAGPYTWHSWSSTGTSGSSTSVKVYCQHRDAVYGEWMTMMDNRNGNEKYEVDGGLLGIVLSSIATWFVPGLLLAYARVRKGVAEQKARIPELEGELARLEGEA